MTDRWTTLGPGTVKFLLKYSKLEFMVPGPDVLQSEELMKAIADSLRSYEDILRYIKGETSEDEG